MNQTASIQNPTGKVPSEIEWPSVAIAIPTFNSERHIQRCLSSIFAQDYPGRIEVVVADDGSRDRTLEIANRFPVKILKVNLKNPEKAKLAAYKDSTGEVFFYLDDDNALTSSTWLREMVYPLVEDPMIVGSFTHFTADKRDFAIVRYLSYDKAQRDPFLAYFSAGIEETFIEKRTQYMLCRFTTNRMPPVGLVLYRRKTIERIFELVRIDENRVFDIDLTASFVMNGLQTFAYVPIGVRHSHADDIGTLIRKRITHVKRGYLLSYPNRKFVWFATTDRHSVKRMIQWILLTNLILPLAISGFRKYLKQRDPVFLLEPLVGLVLTDASLFAFLTEPRGRELISEGFSTLIH
ncbi:MAG: glycosyltransferase family 2 protein [Nitrososphaerota archaeon]|nr:glycosyltransferase family 2 protein [Nitrososphaerota archaeon]MDG7024395.1 glycosyltransferase family 2 protein [Nitrososphaerota archaeon]